MLVEMHFTICLFVSRYVTICFTICLFISPDLDGHTLPVLICFTICFTICLFISPDLDGHRAPKMKYYVCLNISRFLLKNATFRPLAGISQTGISLQRVQSDHWRRGKAVIKAKQSG